MTRALFVRLLTIAAVTLTISLVPESSFAQHGGGHGGGGGFHGGGGGFHGGGAGFHSGGFGGSFHGGFGVHGGGSGGFHGGGFHGGGFHGGGFHHGYGGFPVGFGRGWGWGRWGWGGWAWGGWGWGWGLGWGWPWGYGYPYYGSWAPYAYGCPNYAYPSYGNCDAYYSPGNGPGYGDPSSNEPGNYPQGNNSEPDWRHEPGPNQQPHDSVQPDQSEPEPSHSPGSASSPDSKLIIVKYVPRPTSDERTIRSQRSRASFARSNSEQALPKLRSAVRNAIILLRTMPPAARERWLASGHYNKFSPEEQQLLRKYAGPSSEL